MTWYGEEAWSFTGAKVWCPQHHIRFRVDTLVGFCCLDCLRIIPPFSQLCSSWSPSIPYPLYPCRSWILEHRECCFRMFVWAVEDHRRKFRPQTFFAKDWRHWVLRSIFSSISSKRIRRAYRNECFFSTRIRYFWWHYSWQASYQSYVFWLSQATQNAHWSSDEFITTAVGFGLEADFLGAHCKSMEQNHQLKSAKSFQPKSLHRFLCMESVSAILKAHENRILCWLITVFEDTVISIFMHLIRLFYGS